MKNAVISFKHNFLKTPKFERYQFNNLSSGQNLEWFNLFSI